MKRNKIQRKTNKKIAKQKPQWIKATSPFWWSFRRLLSSSRRSSTHRSFAPPSDSLEPTVCSVLDLLAIDSSSFWSDRLSTSDKALWSEGSPGAEHSTGLWPSLAVTISSGTGSSESGNRAAQSRGSFFLSLSTSPMRPMRRRRSMDGCAQMSQRCRLGLQSADEAH